MEIAGGTANSVVDAVYTTKGVQITEVFGFRGTGPTLLIVGVLRPRFDLPTTLVFQFFMHWGPWHIFLLGLW